MFGILAGIVGLIAIGCIIAYAVIVTFTWLKNKIKEKLAAKKAKKVAVADLNELIDECDNKMSLDDLENLADEGYTHLVATVDNDNKVSDVEIIKDENDTIDSEVESLINRTHKGMVVIEG